MAFHETGKKDHVLCMQIIEEAKKRGQEKAKKTKSMIVLDVKPWDDTTGAQLVPFVSVENNAENNQLALARSIHSQQKACQALLLLSSDGLHSRPAKLSSLPSQCVWQLQA